MGPFLDGRWDGKNPMVALGRPKGRKNATADRQALAKRSPSARRADPFWEYGP